MSKFFSQKYSSLVPYVPGEQPKEREYIKLNTNESPFPPSPKAIEYASAETEKCYLYSDPESKALTKAISDYHGISDKCVLTTNGSDEILNFAFMAFCDKTIPAVYPDITYGFYKVFAEINGVTGKEISLKPDFTIDITDYFNANGTVFIANPNAPTGIALTLNEIEQIVKNNPNNVVVIDEAYVDFGGQTAIPLIDKYDNLLVTRTFSKSRSLAGARLGYGVASPSLIADLNAIKYSTNPYNVNRITAMAGIGSVEDDKYFKDNLKSVIENREYASEELKRLGFTLTQSKANFIFAKSDKIGGEELYLKLKEKGILVRHFTKEKIKEYNRITVGSMAEMQALITAIEDILED